MKNIKNLLNNKGVALIYVIVASSVILLLGATTTAVAFANLHSTQAQIMAASNQYGVDSIMDAIVSGLERDVSDIYEEVYSDIVVKDGQKTQGELSDADIQKQFSDEFLYRLGYRLADSSSDGSEERAMHYSVAHIQGYASNVFPKSVKYTISAVGGSDNIDLLSTSGVDYIVLRNLHVTYENDEGYFDELTTDIKIKSPDYSSVKFGSSAINVLSMAVVADKGITVNQDKALQITGDVFAGSDSNSSILINDNGSLKIISEKESVAAGNVKVGPNAELSVSGINDKVDRADANLSKNTFYSKFWTENVDAGHGAKVSLAGDIMVADDLEVSGAGAQVTLAGAYVGYSSGDESKTAQNSSCININGAHVVLDMSRLKQLILAGSSFLSTTSVQDENNRNNMDIELGEALSVKSNQVAYLVEPKDVKIDKFTSNPIPYEKYSALLMAYNGNFSSLESKILSRATPFNSSKTYRSYCSGVMPVFSGLNSEVYLYFKFASAQKAAEYFNDLCRGDSLTSRRIKAYADQYIKDFSINVDTQVVTAANSIKSVTPLIGSSVGKVVPLEAFEYAVNAAKENGNDALNTCEDYYNEYNGAADESGKKSSNSFASVINVEKLQALIATANDADNGVDKITNGVVVKGSAKDVAVIVDNQGKSTLYLSSLSVDYSSGIIVATGDVCIDKNWTGTIISGGRVTGGAVLSPVQTVSSYVNSNTASQLFVSYTVNNQVKYAAVMNIFKGHEDDVNDLIKTDSVNAKQVAQCITFTNWDKK